ncbi:GH25 family lysozyme [Corallococcus sp. bb12-1]|uniref:GH25 family lysozyme n=1 Tax=Corallococcus sp. bb12-1 TaxID=2996784 RepID=UPI0022707EE4|nr:GH25 family lysozyme [Corallococcus sp. bb12-1]MCY1045652.1 GH25 family lysozyme [Corallococcus sp. bb12-1]
MPSRARPRRFIPSLASTTVPLLLGLLVLTACGGLDTEGPGGPDSWGQEPQALAPSNVQAFYGESRWGTRFGVTGPYYGPAGHRGLDLYASAGQAIPALRSGVVRRVQYSSVVGHTVAVESAPGDFTGYAHVIRTRFAVGDTVQQGDILAYVAGSGDDHGSAWTGPHLHMTRGSTDRCAFGESVSDPAPLIRNVLGTSGGGGTGSGGGSGGIQVSVEEGKTLQRVAQRGGYTGPVDGVPGSLTWKGVQTVIAGKGFYSGPIDGLPGENTWKGVQRLAQLGGYTGPVDGFPGTYTYAGLNTWLAQDPGTPPPSGMRGVYGIDVGTTQRDLDFTAIRNAGYQFAIVKAGGSNVSPLYVAPYYAQQVARARAAGLLVGHYWMAGSYNPAGDAQYFMDHLYDHRPGDLLVLDNEAIDDGIFWSDALTASFMQAVKTRLGKAPFLYTYSSLLQANTWPKTQAVGSKLWIAHYTGTPGNPTVGTAYPTWEIHQYTSSGNQNGIPLDLNVAKLSAFAGLAQPPAGVTPPPPTAIPGGSSGGGGPVITAPQGRILQSLARRGGYTGPIDGVPGSSTWSAVQKVLRELGYYDGPSDGVPGLNTYKGLQLLAQDGGYTGPIDGIPGANTYNGIQAYLDGSSGPVPPVTNAQGVTLQRIACAGGYTGGVDGVPGANTWKGVQQVLGGYGYSGPVDGVMGTQSWMALQRFATKGGYTGPIDGAMGTSSWKGVQTVLRGFGYTGPVDGVMGAQSYAALQRVARLGGYMGPPDGVLGVNSWRGLQTFLSGAGYTGPLDGVPGTNTYKVLQSLANRGGYVGPMDGIPGSNTYAGLANLLD